MYVKRKVRNLKQVFVAGDEDVRLCRAATLKYDVVHRIPANMEFLLRMNKRRGRHKGRDARDQRPELEVIDLSF